MKVKEYTKMFQLEQSHWFFICKRMFIAAFIKKFPLKRGSLIFDAGCGAGANHLFLENYGKVVSLDISPDAIRYCQKRNLSGLIQADLNRFNFKKSSFDMAAALDVLYHSWIQDDQALLNQFYHILKPGGRLLLTDSAFQLLVSRHDKAVMTRERYTIPKLREKLKEAGFTIQRSSYMFFTTFPLLVMVRFLQKFSRAEEDAESNLFPLPLWVNKMILGIMKIEALLLSWIPLPFGSSVIILAEKPE